MVFLFLFIILKPLCIFEELAIMGDFDGDTFLSPKLLGCILVPPPTAIADTADGVAEMK
eukprot:CAMPEP_0170510108 /NCGR_PEP_ID=MMETSP0208-20121228/65586_1 /TAXON_ID=197538 /ORGANISM="Strombidium inclinatum, Strain S3" /LENGTH=58 /DNA_ID=CAMNT_0010793539 /DNA_START=1706 /DNA_END=1879 /DNA_ORIENTATION=-